ncbi:MAG: DUF4954 family protein, partial [Prolixibacteraceae bacterium]|nr:DUF4954 family protein [Prolixibacteraceae bacterium]
IDVSVISREELLIIISDWKTNSVKFNNIILKDAEKEFDRLSRISFGHDGNEDDQRADFEAIRGTYELNSFVKEIKKDSERIEQVHRLLTEKFNKIAD